MDMDSRELPDLKPDSFFQFSCGPEMPCFNRCCAQLNLPLTPYDAMRLSLSLGITSADFLRTFAGRRREPETGFPMFHLRMIDSPDAPCPFVTPAGCLVYEDRPGACRSYPLGRGARLSYEGICERYFMIKEEHCRGFDSGRIYTAKEWFADQGLEQYTYFNDRYMRLMSLVAASGKPLDQRLSGMAALCLWEPDRFRDFIEQYSLFSQVNITEEDAEKILEKTEAGGEACLDFGIDWLELVIFGTAEGLARRA